jgi:hypothetical protein
MFGVERALRQLELLCKAAMVPSSCQMIGRTTQTAPIIIFLSPSDHGHGSLLMTLADNSHSPLVTEKQWSML